MLIRGMAVPNLATSNLAGVCSRYVTFVSQHQFFDKVKIISK